MKSFSVFLRLKKSVLKLILWADRVVLWRALCARDIPKYYCEKLRFDFPTTLPDVSKKATEDHKDCPYHTERP